MDGPVTLRQLFGEAFAPLMLSIRRYILRKRIKGLKLMADYFEEQVQNGREGMADTHKRLCIAESDLRSLG